MNEIEINSIYKYSKTDANRTSIGNESTFNCSDLIISTLLECMTADHNWSAPLSAANNTDLTGAADAAAVVEPSAGFLFFLEQSRFWIQRIFVPLIMIIGVIGNSITIVIMTRRRMRSSTNWYLAALATFDMMYLIFTFILSFRHYENIKDIHYYYYWVFWPYAVMVCDGSSNTSIWLTVTFTIERYIAVCHPMKGKVICTESRARKLIFCVFIVCFAFTIPTPFEWTILERQNADTNRTYLQVTFSELGQNELYKTVYYWSTVMLFVFAPFLLLTIFNSFLIRSVHISRRQRRTMTRPNESSLKNSSSASSSSDTSTKQESRITIMLIAVVLLFLICQLPTAITLIYSAIHDVDQHTNAGVLVRALGNIFNFLMAINAAGNFLLYCVLSQKYRRTFMQTFCPCLKGRVHRFQSAYYTHTSDVKSSVRQSAKRLSGRPDGRQQSRPSERMVTYVDSSDALKSVERSDNSTPDRVKSNGDVFVDNSVNNKW